MGAVKELTNNCGLISTRAGPLEVALVGALFPLLLRILRAFICNLKYAFVFATCGVAVTSTRAFDRFESSIVIIQSELLVLPFLLVNTRKSDAVTPVTSNLLKVTVPTKVLPPLIDGQAAVAGGILFTRTNGLAVTARSGPLS